MASLPESVNYDAGVYQIETTDPVIGGPSGVTNTPLKNLANRTAWLKAQVDAIAAAFAPKASPALTGTPTAPTASAGTNTTQLATTAFVKTAVDGKDLSGYAPLASPVLTGNPTAPTPAKFDNDTSLATTEFVRRQGVQHNALFSFDANAVLTADHVGGFILGYGSTPYTLTLPATSAVPDGAVLSFYVTNTYITLATQGSDKVLYGGGGFTNSFRIDYGDTLTLVRNGNAWTVNSGTASVKYANGFQSSIGGAGYQKLPSGLIIQWTNLVTPATNGNDAWIAFPITFPNAVFNVVHSFGPVAPQSDITTPLVVASWSTSGAVLKSYTGADNVACLIAIGY